MQLFPIMAYFTHDTSSLHLQSLQQRQHSGHTQFYLLTLKIQEQRCYYTITAVIKYISYGTKSSVLLFSCKRDIGRPKLIAGVLIKEETIKF